MILDCHTHRVDAEDAIINIRVTAGMQQAQAQLIAHGRLYSAGVHPWDAVKPDCELLESLAADDRVVAIGETGLDALHADTLAEQERLFRHHIALAECVDKPLIIHCVRAIDRLLHVWRDTAPHRVPVVFHAMRRGARIARMLLDAGFNLSYGARFDAEALRLTPDERLLIETDDADVSIYQVLNAVAAARGTSPERLADIIAGNTSRMFTAPSNT